MEFMPFRAIRAVVLVEIAGADGPVRMAINMMASEVEFRDDGDYIMGDDRYFLGYVPNPKVMVEGDMLNMTLWKGEWPETESQPALDRSHASIESENDSSAPQS